MAGAIILLIMFCLLGFYIGYEFAKHQLFKTMCDVLDNVTNDSDDEFIKGVIYVSKSLQKIM